MIRYLWTYKLSTTTFLQGLPAFWSNYWKTRTWSQLLLGVPAVLLAAAAVTITQRGGQLRESGELAVRYEKRMQQALVSGNFAAAELNLGRLLPLCDDPQAQTFQFAGRLFDINGGSEQTGLLIAPVSQKDTAADSPQTAALVRALSIMQNLAPRLGRQSGYRPAHAFLADFWLTRTPATNTTRILGLQHRLQADPGKYEPALQLARLIQPLGFHQQALDVLTPHREAHADVLVQMALAWDSLKQSKKSRAALLEASRKLDTQLAADATNRPLRKKLSRVLVAAGRPLDGLLLMAEGMPRTPTAAESDLLIQHYTWWISSIPRSQIAPQLAQLQLALKWSERPPAALDQKTSTLTMTSGETVTLPGPIVAFHEALNHGEGRWLLPLLLGSSAAAAGELENAVELLKDATACAPSHPVVANNLAWTLHKLSQQRTGKAGAPVESEIRDHARQLVERALQIAPQEPHFRATRGVLAVAQENWTLAIDDLEFAVTANLSSNEILAALALARRKRAESQSAADESDSTAGPSSEP
ncbi:MAG: hypothetical protein NXI04_23030 [Planctomycetaceae bacterium]|nr:hypothetical protein [Planctomycetaceae bacterium]